MIKDFAVTGLVMEKGINVAKVNRPRKMLTGSATAFWVTNDPNMGIDFISFIDQSRGFLFPISPTDLFMRSPAKNLKQILSLFTSEIQSDFELKIEDSPNAKLIVLKPGLTTEETYAFLNVDFLEFGGYVHR